VTAPLPGTVLSVSVTEGQQVKAGQVLLIFEAMKMENEIVSPAAGTVKKIHVAKGAALETGMVVVTIA
jgi:biotin carboxyl carrier protein